MSEPVRPEFWVFLPQLATTVPKLVERARAAEEAGFTGVALMDHLQAPGAPQVPCLDAMLTAGALLGATERLRLTHLVLCAVARHPAMLAQQAATLDTMSGGRFELGAGWGSVPSELRRFGISSEPAAVRSRRLVECLDVVRALLGGEEVDHPGEFHTLRGARLAPSAPHLPVLVGGAGPRLTMPVVRSHADWWNLPSYAVPRARELADLAGGARRSVQVVVGLAGPDDDPDEVAAVTRRRLGAMGELVTGRAPEVAERLGELTALGFERFFVWFGDLARPATLANFMREVAPRVPAAAHS